MIKKTIYQVKIFCSIFILFFIVNVCGAATITSNTTGNWSSTSTWIGGVVPTSSDNVIISNSDIVTLNVNAVVISVEIKVFAKLIVQANLTTTSTASGSLKFSGNTAGGEGILEMLDNTSRFVSISGDIAMGTGSGFRGAINVNNGNHILEVKGNLNCPTSGGLNLLSGTLKLTGSANATFDNASATAFINNLEIGDGVTAKQVSINSAVTGAIRFNDNTTITIKNVATFILNGVSRLNAPSPAGLNVSLNILNGGKVYSGTPTTGYASDVLQNIPLMNNALADADVNTGQLFLYGLSNTASNFKVPVGKIGDLVFGRSGTTSGATVTINIYGTGARTVKILGNLTASKSPSTTTSTTPYLFASGTASTTDAGVSIWELSGGTAVSFKDFLYDRNGSITFGTSTSSGTKPSEQPTLKITGYYYLQHNNNANNSTFRVHNMELANNAQLLMGANFTENNGTNGTEGNPHNFYLRGAITIGSNAVFDISTNANIASIDPSSFATIGTVLWSGTGTLKLYCLRGHTSNSDCIINSSIANIYIRGNSTKASTPIPCSNFGNGSNTNFVMTSGNWIFENGVLGGPGFQESLSGSGKYSLHNVILEDGVNLYLNHNNSAAGSYFKITGNLDLKGSATIGSYLNATGAGFLEFAGTSNQLIGGGSGIGLMEIRNLKINNAQGITLLRDLHLTKKNSSSTTAYLDFTNGKIFTASNALLVVYPSFSPSNFTNNSFVSGPMRYFVQNTAHSLSNQNNPVFITGKNSMLGRVGLTNITGFANNDYFDAEYFTGTSADALGPSTTPVTTLVNTHSYSPAVIKCSEREYWKIEKGSTSGTNISMGKVTLYYEDNSFSKLADKGKDKLRVMHWTGSAWDDEGNDNTNATQASTSNGSINSDQIISSFSPFTFGSTDLTLNPLPATIINIRGEVTGATNTVYWTTATEANNRKFVVERSVNGNNFTAIGEVATRAINSNTALQYSFVDASPVQGKAYYRLQMVDNNVRATYSQIVTLRRGAGKLEIVDVRPNPTTGNIYFNLLGVNNNSQFTLTLRTVEGKAVLVKNNFTPLGAGVIDMSKLANGMYILEAVDVRNNEKAVFKVVKQ